MSWDWNTGGYRCPQCGTLAKRAELGPVELPVPPEDDAPQTGDGAQTPDRWQTTAELDRLATNLGLDPFNPDTASPVSATQLRRHTGSPPDTAGLAGPHFALARNRVGNQASANKIAQPNNNSRCRHALRDTFALLTTCFGTSALACGITLTAIGIARQTLLLWQIGVPTALVGHMVIVLAWVYRLQTSIHRPHLKAQPKKRKRSELRSGNGRPVETTRKLRIDGPETHLSPTLGAAKPETKVQPAQ